MKLIDKLKNALFEEEYVEVEEKPRPTQPKKEKPIAKKIIVPKEEKQVVEEKEEEKKEFVFPMMEEEDFIDLTDKVQEKEEVVMKEPRREEEPVVRQVPVYQEPQRPYQEPPLEVYPTKKEEKTPYSGGKQKDVDIPMHEYGYEKKKDKKEFQPSPIISPVYGILDKNYKKEDVVSKKEVRLTSSYASTNRMDLDAVRAKAYGEVDDSIFEEELTEQEDTKKELEFPKEEEEVLLDISDNQTPTVPKVTVGDAEEYFQDLGLEYNIDYKDASKERATGRRTNLRNQDVETEKDELEENLFDLIDSMYEEKDGE